MDLAFLKSLEERARERHARIGIGIWRSDERLIASLRSATEYADLLLVGDPCCDCELDYIQAEEPWEELVRLLQDGEIEGAVRGNLPAGRTMRALAAGLGVRVRRLALMDLSGWAFLLGPVGIDEGETASDRLALVTGGAELLRGLGVAAPRASLLSGGRIEDLGRSDRVDRSLAEGELIASLARSRGTDARHAGILIEECRGEDIIIAPDGVSGNLVFRTLLFLCRASSLGAPVLMERGVFVDSSRTRSGFDGPVMLASAMVSLAGR